MRKWLYPFMTIMLLINLVACSQGEKSTDAKKDVFNIGMIPDQNVADINRSMDDFAAYLSEKTGLNVKFVPSVDYSALVTGFERGEIQLAWFGGLTGVQARNVVPGAEAIAQRPTDEKFESVFIKQKGLPIHSLADLKGKSFTFGSESSTSGHLMPRYFLMEAGIDADKDFKSKPNYSGSHDTTYKLVESGAYETGALNISVWEAAVKEGKVDTNKVEVFYTTPPYYDYNWTINNLDDQYGKGTKDKVKEAILSIKSDDSELMNLLQTDSFIETNNENYKEIEKVAKQLGIIK
ncbi:putative selenate ABC transporter substrate-binding protein [Neobacillus sp. D3-1R]|uniref:putative selenate ABC transporter substrate-binding protein n=1 Tax=Neobacillus sp. D3-1R TaxID=3445778 RepID=UPI003FA0CC99